MTPDPFSVFRFLYDSHEVNEIILAQDTKSCHRRGYWIIGGKPLTQCYLPSLCPHWDISLNKGGDILGFHIDLV